MACGKGLQAAVRYTLPPRRRREPALAELGHPEGASGRRSITASHRSRKPYTYAPHADLKKSNHVNICVKKIPPILHQ